MYYIQNISKCLMKIVKISAPLARQPEPIDSTHFVVSTNSPAIISAAIESPKGSPCSTYPPPEKTFLTECLSFLGLSINSGTAIVLFLKSTFDLCRRVSMYHSIYMNG